MSVKQTSHIEAEAMPGRFPDLAILLPPHAIRDEADYDRAIEFMDELLARPRLTKGQTEFFETWSILIGAYESEHHAIDTADLSGLDALKHLLDQGG